MNVTINKRGTLMINALRCILSGLCVGFLNVSCSSIEAPSITEIRSPQRLGNDRDAHGCIGSAGYIWCEKDNQCQRSWELATVKGFANTELAFKNYCDSK